MGDALREACGPKFGRLRLRAMAEVALVLDVPAGADVHQLSHALAEARGRLLTAFFSPPGCPGRMELIEARPSSMSEKDGEEQPIGSE